jgi:hypothetical protein
MHRANRMGRVVNWSLGMHVIYRHKRLHSNIYKGLNSAEVVRSYKEVLTEPAVACFWTTESRAHGMKVGQNGHATNTSACLAKRNKNLLYFCAFGRNTITCNHFKTY